MKTNQQTKKRIWAALAITNGFHLEILHYNIEYKALLSGAEIDQLLSEIQAAASTF